jgi:hypothetical protein
VTPAERAHLLEASAHCLCAAAHLLALPEPKNAIEENPDIMDLIRRGRELAAFAAEMGRHA